MNCVRRNREVLCGLLGLYAAVAVRAADPPVSLHGQTATPSSARPVLADDPGAPGPQTRPADPVTTVSEASPATDDPLILAPRRKPPANAGPDNPTIRSSARTPWYRNGLIAMGIVLASIFAVVLAVRRYVPAARTGAGGFMKVVTRTYLSPKQSVALLQVGRRHVLIGITPDRLTNLGHIEDPQESFDLRVQTAPSTPPREDVSFDTHLENQAAKYVEPELPADAAAPADAGCMKETIGRMQDLLARLRSIQEEVR